MLNRFTGTDERKAGLITTVPLKRVGRPKRLPRPSCFFHLTRHPSSRVRRSSSTAAKQPNKTMATTHQPAGHTLPGSSEAVASTPGARIRICRRVTEHIQVHARSGSGRWRKSEHPCRGGRRGTRLLDSSHQTRWPSLDHGPTTTL